MTKEELDNIFKSLNVETIVISVLEGLQALCDNLDERVSTLLGRVNELEIGLNNLKQDHMYTKDDVYRLFDNTSTLEHKILQIIKELQ